MGAGGRRNGVGRWQAMSGVGGLGVGAVGAWRAKNNAGKVDGMVVLGLPTHPDMWQLGLTEGAAMVPHGGGLL